MLKFCRNESRLEFLGILMKYYNKEIETMSRENLFALQSERLVKQVRNVYDRVPYYRAKMDAIGLKPEDIGSISDISKLPFTVKTDIRANYPFGLFGCDRKKVVRLHASSGTTGKLTVVGYTKRDLNTWAECCARAMTSAGLTKNDTVHIAYGYGLFTGGLGLHYGVEKLGATAVPVSTGNTMRQLMLLKDFGATAIACTPSYALYLAEELKTAGLTTDDLMLKTGIFGAEPWTEEMRREIEDRLKIEAFDIYGLSEISGPGVAMECKSHCGKHVYEDFFYPEIIDPYTLKPLPYGEKGELVFTTLTKECIPLIRYRTRDICTLYNEPCECGRTLVRMGKIEGRSDDMLIIRGVNIFPSQIETVLLNIGGMIGPHYRIILDRVGSLDTLEIQVELAEHAFSDEIRDIENLKARISHDMQSMLGVSAKSRSCRRDPCREAKANPTASSTDAKNKEKIMLVNQLAVFLENRKGRLKELAGVLAKEKIDILTLSIADTEDFGIVRFITTDNARARSILRGEGFTVTETELIGVEIGDVPGALAKVLKALADGNISIEYLYSYSRTGGNAIILFKVKEVGRALDVLSRADVRVLDKAL